ncbi:hypothetical protein [Ralstonia phage RSP15]|uniref:hypothetical protein n=1 Tax=Ralstonia phage RSP15 TaxID=1785960 RepID=UPI00074D3987|nr:hypothetical protein BH754_gp118 [Ralstonia phage RSP15]BAU40188.1 hypothetical protein [Ralstonia phage RSP15]
MDLSDINIAQWFQQRDRLAAHAQYILNFVWAANHPGFERWEQDPIFQEFSNEYFEEGDNILLGYESYHGCGEWGRGCIAIPQSIFFSPEDQIEPKLLSLIADLKKKKEDQEQQKKDQEAEAAKKQRLQQYEALKKEFGE